VRRGQAALTQRKLPARRGYIAATVARQLRATASVMDLDIARDFLVALLIGALVGIDRERKKANEPEHPSFGGIRTHILLALAGAASAWLSIKVSMPWTFVVTLLVVGSAIVASYLQQNRTHDDAYGLTSELAAIVVFLLGAMAVAGATGLAAALGVATSALLAYKQPLHGLVRRIDTQDLFAGLKLLIASFIVLPLLPDRAIDPWDAINPYKLWLLVIMISALSLAGYVAVRWLGSAHGAVLTGAAGGLVSSTATTLAFARSSRSDGGNANALAAGVLLSWLVMFARVAVIVGIVNRALLAASWLPLAAMAAVTASFAAWHYRAGLSGARRGAALAIANPFSLAAAARFGGLFAVVLLIVELTRRHGPAGSLYVVAALAGSVDVDAIILSMADAAPTGSELASTGIAVAVAVVANTLVKCGMVLALGAPALKQRVGVATVAVLAAGGLAAALA
jgi:uncharacterized membrane protein (DUF4010 family)